MLPRGYSEKAVCRFSAEASDSATDGQIVKPGGKQKQPKTSPTPTSTASADPHSPDDQEMIIADPPFDRIAHTDQFRNLFEAVCALPWPSTPPCSARWSRRGICFEPGPPRPLLCPRHRDAQAVEQALQFRQAAGSAEAPGPVVVAGKVGDALLPGQDLVHREFGRNTRHTTRCCASRTRKGAARTR
jgi:hypothetical protein